MAKRSFRLRLPHQPMAEQTVAEYRLARASDANLMARRTRLLGALAGLTERERNRHGRAVAAACRMVLADRSAKIRFQIGDWERQLGVEVVITADAERVADNPSFKSASGQETGGRSEGSDGGQEPPGSVIRQDLAPLVSELAHFEVEEADNRLRIVLVQAGSHALHVTEDEVASWAELLNAKSPEEAVALAQLRRQQATEELGVARSKSRPHESEQAANEEDLETLSLVVSRATNAILIMGANGVIQWTNHAFRNATGYSSAEVLGRRLDELLFGPSTNGDAVREVQQGLRNGHEVSTDVLQYRRDGRTYWVEFKLIPVLDDNCRVTRWIAIQSDVTRRRQTEEALRAAKQAAELSSRSKSEFLANMSHEIRTPLNAILGMSELALTTDLTREQRDYLRTVQTSADTLLRLLNDVLDISKIEAGKLEIEEVDFNLAEVVQETIDALAVRAREKGLSIAAEIPPDVPRHVRGDPMRIRQVLFNLVGNAIKFTEQGEVSVQVEEQWRTDDEACLHFSVRDTGIGIPAPRLSQIFESFAQVDSSIARRFGGTGLGLTITSQLLRLMQGKIWVKSQEGKGSTFHFTLQLKLTKKSRAPEPQPDGDVLQSDASHPKRTLRVLVTDDHEPNRRLAMRILERRGHHCHPACDGDQAMEALEKEEAFDAILMDVQMPGCDGLTATRRIRERERMTGQRVPIIALTAHALAGDRDKCLQAGMDAYLAKPIHARELVTLVERIANPRSADGDPRGLAPSGSPGGEKPFDIDAALERMDGEVDLLREHIGYVLNDMPQLLAQMRIALEERNAHGLELSAHRLKSLVSSYNHHAARQLAESIEKQARQGDLSAIADALVRLTPLLDEFATAVADFRQQSHV